MSGDGADDALFAEQASTSLYERTDGSGEKHVLPLTRAQPTYCKVSALPTTPQTEGAVDNGQPEIVVQVRKRKGKLQIFIDGYHSEGRNDLRDGANVRVHNLSWHRGLHEDVQTDTRVFSPLAIVAAIEDGQRPMQDVTVSVWTTFENNQSTVFEHLLVAETRLVPHRVTDARCNTVRAPYPLAYPPPPSLTIYDRLRYKRQTGAQTIDVAGKGILKAFTKGYQAFKKRRETENSLAWPSRFLNDLADTVFGADTDAQSSTSILVERTGLGLGATAIATGFQSARYDLVASVALSTIPYADQLWNGIPLVAYASIGNWALAAKIASAALYRYVNGRPDAEQEMTKFTIKELARTVFSLSVIRTKQGMAGQTVSDEFRRQQSEQFRREQIVWEWLRDAKNEVKAPDTQMLAVSQTFATRLRVRIAIDDALGCDPSEEYHEITCERDDCYELGALAAGTLRDIEFLFEAIDAFERTLDAGIASKTATDTWWDSAYNLVTKVRDTAAKAFGDTKERFDKMPEGERTQFAKDHPEELAKIQAYNKAGDEIAEEEKALEGKTEAEVQAAEDKAQEDEEAQVRDAAKEHDAKAAERDKEQDPEKRKDLDAQLKKLYAKWTELRTKGIWKEIKRRTSRVGKNYVADISDPAQETRRGVLRAIKKGLHDKLCSLFLESNQAGYELYKLLQAKRDAKHLPMPVPGTCQYIRRLPHRATAHNTKRLFLFRADRSNGFVDMTTRVAATRVFSEYYDANQLIAAAMDASATAMHRLVREWEANSSTRVKLECMCEKYAVTEKALKERVALGTLVLSTPVDVQAAGALAEPTERERRQIRLVARRAQQKGDQSALERMGLTHDDASLLALQIFGGLWADELVTLHKLGARAKQVQMLEQASRRATARLRAAGKLLLDLLTVHNPEGGATDFDDVPCNATDVALVATQRGRDAGMIIERLLFGKNYVAIRAAFAPLLREVARAAGRCADAFERAVPEHLPYEPVASLFDRDRAGGVAAYLRVQRALPLGDIVSAAAAAYPSVLLLGADEASQQAAEDLANAQGVPEAPAEPNLRFDALVRTLRYRLASLKMDELPVAWAADGNESGAIDVDQLAQHLSSTSLSARSHSFYVPFGFGDARPPPTLPALSAPMFGSVPVFGPHLGRAFAALQATGGKAKRPYRVTLRPTFGCLAPLANDEGASVHPNVVQARATSDGGVEVLYTASRVWGTKLSKPDTRYANARQAAEAHLQNENATGLAADVCAIAWNAERVMQAVIAALASAPDGPDAHDGLALRLVLPGKAEEQSVWFARPNNPLARAQKSKYADRRLRFAGLVLWHSGQAHQRLARQFWEELDKRKAMDGQELKDLDKQLKALELSYSLGAHARIADNATARQSLMENYQDFDRYSKRVYDNAQVDVVGGDDAPASWSEAVQKKTQNDTKAALNALFVQMAPTAKRVQQDFKVWQTEQEATTKLVPAAGDGDDAREARAHAGLVSALGIGMGMLSPLLGDRAPMQVEAVQLAAEDDQSPSLNWTDENDARKSLEGAFNRCNAMRLSEACLVVLGVLSDSHN